MRAVNVEAQACNTSPWLKEEDREFEANLSYVMRLYFGGGEGTEKRAAAEQHQDPAKCSEKDIKSVRSRDSITQRAKSATWAGPGPFPAPRSLTRTHGSGGTMCGL